MEFEILEKQGIISKQKNLIINCKNTDIKGIIPLYLLDYMHACIISVDNVEYIIKYPKSSIYQNLDTLRDAGGYTQTKLSRIITDKQRIYEIFKSTAPTEILLGELIMLTRSYIDKIVVITCTSDELKESLPIISHFHEKLKGQIKDTCNNITSDNIENYKDELKRIVTKLNEENKNGD